MGMEIEVKILNINVENETKKILGRGGKFKKDIIQKLYTYDLPSIYMRYQDILYHLNLNLDSLQYEVYINKLQTLLFELDNLVPNPKLKLFQTYNLQHFSEIAFSSNIKKILNSQELCNFFKTYDVNPHKWIRLRTTGTETTLAVKHILAPDSSSIQALSETEVKVSSFSEANSLLQQLGFSFKSYQEKRRLIYELCNHEIDIDFWPEIPPYMEIEGNSEKDLAHILNMLNYSIEDTVSCTADQIYIKYGKNMFNKRTLIFPK